MGKFFGMHLARAVLLLALFSGWGGVVQPPAALAGWAGSAQAETGILNITQGDGQPGSGLPAQMRAVLLRADGSQVRLLLNEPLPVPVDTLLKWSGNMVNVSGSRVTDAAKAPGFAGDPSTPALEVGAIALAQDARAPAAPDGTITGSHPWISILCKFNDADLVNIEPKTPAYFSGMYSSAFPGLDHYWREVSYNNINVVGSGAVTHWYTLPKPRSFYLSTTNSTTSFNLGQAETDCTAAADADVNFSLYDGANLMFNSDLDGYAWGGSSYYSHDGKRLRMTWEPPWGYADITVIAHEMGHGFGFPHSSYKLTYDNVWDVMSDTWSYCSLLRDNTTYGTYGYGCLGQGTISYHKNLDGWIAAGKKLTVSSGSYGVYTLERLAQPQTANLLMITLPVAGDPSSRYYTVEARRRVGYDQKLPGDAVIIHEINPSRTSPAKPMTADTSQTSAHAAAQWTPGEKFLDAAAQIWVRVLSATSSGYTVAVCNSCGITVFDLAVQNADQLAPDTLHLTWTQIDGDATSVMVQRSAHGAGAWSDIASLAAGAAAYDDTSPSCAALNGYDYRLKLVHAADFGYSNPGSGLVLPCAPSGLNAAPASETAVNLTWTDAAWNETGYAVDRDTVPSSGGWTQLAVLPAGAAAYADSALLCGSAYNYRVRVVNAAGSRASAPAGAVSTTACTLPAAAPLLTTAPGSITSIRLAWSDLPNEKQYLVERSPDGLAAWETVSGSLPANTIQWVDTSVITGATWYYRVTGVNDAGSSPASQVVPGTTFTIAMYIPLAMK
jgi:M6 family metalloprotease-like protein